MQGAADRQNEVTEKRSIQRPVNIPEIGAEVVILLKVKCEEISYSKKKKIIIIIASVLTINPRVTKYLISSGIHLFQAFFWERGVWMESTSVVFSRVHKIEKSDNYVAL